MTVHLESADLTHGVPVMHRVDGDRVRAAYDPQQIDEAAALAWLCLQIPQLIREGFTVLYAVP